MTEAVKDYLGMSDEDFLNINAPEATVASDDDKNQVETPGSDVVVEEQKVEEPGKEVEENKADEAAVSDGKTADEPAADADGDKADPAAKPETKVAEGDKAKAADVGAADKSKAAEADGAEAADKTKTEEKPVDYEAFFKQIMTPFKANGREIKLNSPDEAIRLMQMGAGYGRKIQDMQPHLKTLRMLEKNNLLDEGKLSFLIDINNKNPDAIKKIIKDSGIDPLDLNIQDNVSYSPKNHAVSDKEMAFHSALEEVQSSETGQETLRVINQTWDQESKSVLWESPEIMKVIQDQRDNGIYDKITAEIDRQKLLGTIPHTASFLQAYKLAGDMLYPPQAQPIQTQPVVTPQPQVIATRTAAPKAQVQNGDKAAAAASTKTTTTRKAAGSINPLEMADDEFLKQFKDRL